MAEKSYAGIEGCRSCTKTDSVQLDRVSRFGVVNDSQYNHRNNAVTLHGPTHSTVRVLMMGSIPFWRPMIPKRARILMLIWLGRRLWSR